MCSTLPPPNSAKASRHCRAVSPKRSMSKICSAGHSSLRHIIQLSPDFVKVDISLTRNVDADLARRALISALLHYTRETSAQIVAEGIETEAELRTLKLLGVRRGQGYFLGRPSINAFGDMKAEARKA